MRKTKMREKMEETKEQKRHDDENNKMQHKKYKV